MNEIIEQATAEQLKLLEHEKVLYKELKGNLNRFQKLCDHSLGEIKKIEKSLEDIKTAEVMFSGLNPVRDILAEIEKLEGIETDSINERQDIYYKLKELKDKLRKECHHPFIIWTPYGPSYCSYEDSEPEWRKCLVCGLEERIYGEGKELDEGLGRLFLRSYSGTDFNNNKIRNDKDVDNLPVSAFCYEILQKLRKNSYLDDQKCLVGVDLGEKISFIQVENNQGTVKDSCKE